MSAQDSGNPLKHHVHVCLPGSPIYSFECLQNEVGSYISKAMYICIFKDSVVLFNTESRRKGQTRVGRVYVFCKEIKNTVQKNFM